MSRIRPQPIGTSMMIFRRRRASQKRYDKLDVAREMVALVQEESAFERRVGENVEGRWGDEWRGWMAEARQREIKEQARNAVRPDLGSPQRHSPSQGRLTSSSYTAAHPARDAAKGTAGGTRARTAQGRAGEAAAGAVVSRDRDSRTASPSKDLARESTGAAKQEVAKETF